MTGFGSATREDDGRAYSLEMRSLNGRYYKAQTRLPEELSGLEVALETRLGRRLTRGSVTVTVRIDDRSAEAAAVVNTAAVRRYLDQIQDAIDGSKATVTIDAAALLSLPGVLADPAAGDRMEAARPVLEALLDEAADALVAMRESEGAKLHADLIGHLDGIETHLEEVRLKAPLVVEGYQDRLRQRMEALLAERGATVRDEDLLREVAVFAERSDIAEEIARLGGHLEQFRTMLDGDGDKPVGRTMDFLAQELLREANTIGSKCLDADVGRRIVEIKGAIDRVKEQVQNVE